MTHKHAFLLKLGQQQADGRDPTPQRVADALGWDFSRTSRVVEELTVGGLVVTTPAARRSGDTHLDDWVTLTAEGKAVAQVVSQDDDTALPTATVDRWDRIDLPVLRHLAAAAESDAGEVLLHDIASRLKLRPRDVMQSFDNLRRAGFVDAQFGPDNGGEYSFIRLTEKGFRATDLWPTPETALDRMIAALESIAKNTDEDADNRTKAQKLAAWLRASGTTVGLSVASTVITGQLPGNQ